MKILILSCNTGEGHNSAAKAIVDAAEKRQIECEIANPIAFKNERAKRLVDSSYNNMIKKTPKLFGAVYKIGDVYDRSRLPSPIYGSVSLCAKPLNKYIVEKGFDAVICTHLFGMEAMTAIRRRKMNRIPCYGVMTDYTCVPFFDETILDGYLIPHADLTDEMVKRGIPRERIYATGIPVAEKFAHHIGRAAARARLNIPDDRRVYLIMSGGVGCGNISTLCDKLTEIESGDYEAYVLAGKNKNMIDQLKEHFGDHPNIHIVPFTTEVNIYMEAADVMISKPGGLSSTEAAVSGIPLVHMMTIPGCETKNAKFYLSHGMAVRAESVSDAVILAKHLADHPDEAAEMRRMQQLNSNPASADMILDLVTENV